MVATALTNAGETYLLQAGAQIRYAQLGRTRVAEADWPTQTAVPGAFKVIPVVRLIVEDQAGFTGVDTSGDDYDDFRCIGYWNDDPTMNASAILVSFGSAAPGESYPEKISDVSFYITGLLALSAAQQVNITPTSLQMANADEARHGVVRYNTDAEADAGVEDRAASNPRGVARYIAAWWNALSSSTIFGKLPIANQTQAQSASNATAVMTPQRTRQAVTHWWANVLTTVTLLSRIPFASKSQAEGGTHTESVMNPLRTAEAIAALSPSADVQTFNASGTWTKPTGAKSVHIAIWGGGSTNVNSSSPTGTNGAASIVALPASLLPATVTVTIGAAGTTGGNSFFGSVFATGGLPTGGLVYSAAASIFERSSASSAQLGIGVSALAGLNIDTPFTGGGAYGPGVGTSGRAIITTFF